MYLIAQWPLTMVRLFGYKHNIDTSATTRQCRTMCGLYIYSAGYRWPQTLVIHRTYIDALEVDPIANDDINKIVCEREGGREGQRKFAKFQTENTETQLHTQ